MNGGIFYDDFQDPITCTFCAKIFGQNDTVNWISREPSYSGSILNLTYLNTTSDGLRPSWARVELTQVELI